MKSIFEKFTSKYYEDVNLELEKEKETYIEEKNILEEKIKIYVESIEKSKIEIDENVIKKLEYKKNIEKISNEYNSLVRDFQYIIDIYNRTDNETKIEVIEELKEILNKLNVVDDEVGVSEILNDCLKKSKRLERFGEIYTKNIIAVAGGFSSGKSTFLNSLFDSNEIELSTSNKPTTSISTYVSHNISKSIKGVNLKGIEVNIELEKFKKLNHLSNKKKINLKDKLEYIVVNTNVKNGKYENICLVDTPGYNPGSKDDDFNESFEIAKNSDEIIWVLSVEAGEIGKTDIDFLTNPLLENIPKYFILNKAKMRNEEIREKVLDKVKETLNEQGIEYEGITLYDSLDKIEFSSKKITLTLEQFFEKYNYKKDLDSEIKKMYLEILNKYSKGIKEKFKELDRKIDVVERILNILTEKLKDNNFDRTYKISNEIIIYKKKLIELYLKHVEALASLNKIKKNFIVKNEESCSEIIEKYEGTNGYSINGIFFGLREYSLGDYKAKDYYIQGKILYKEILGIYNDEYKKINVNGEKFNNLFLEKILDFEKIGFYRNGIKFNKIMVNGQFINLQCNDKFYSEFYNDYRLNYHENNDGIYEGDIEWVVKDNYNKDTVNKRVNINEGTLKYTEVYYGNYLEHSEYYERKVIKKSKIKNEYNQIIFSNFSTWLPGNNRYYSTTEYKDVENVYEYRLFDSNDKLYLLGEVYENNFINIKVNNFVSNNSGNNINNNTSIDKYDYDLYKKNNSNHDALNLSDSCIGCLIIFLSLIVGGYYITQKIFNKPTQNIISTYRPEIHNDSNDNNELENFKNYSVTSNLSLENVVVQVIQNIYLGFNQPEQLEWLLDKNNNKIIIKYNKVEIKINYEDNIPDENTMKVKLLDKDLELSYDEIF